MAKKGFLSVRLEEETMKNLDEIAKRNMQSRSEAIRTLIAESSSDPYQVLQDASQGEFSSGFLNYLVILNDSLAGTKEVGHDISPQFTFLREWLLRNPYHPNAAARVRAVVAHSCRFLLPHTRHDTLRLEKIVQIEETEWEYQEFQREYASWTFYKPEEVTDDDEE